MSVNEDVIKVNYTKITKILYIQRAQPKTTVQKTEATGNIFAVAYTSLRNLTSRKLKLRVQHHSPAVIAI